MFKAAKMIIISCGIILSFCVAAVAINVMALKRCNDFLNSTYRVGHYEFFSGKCYIKTNSGKLILREDINKKIVSVY